MNFSSRTGIKVLAVVVGIGAAGIAADWHLAASPSPVNSMKEESPPRVEVVRPRRVTVAQRLQTNATLEAFEEADLFAKVSGYLSDVRVDIGDHVRAGQVLAVIDVPEMNDELAEAKAQLDSRKSSLESAGRQLDHNKANLALQNALAKDREQLGQGREFISDRTLDEVRANAEIAKADVGVAEANRALATNQVDVAAATVGRSRLCFLYADRGAFRWRGGAALCKPGRFGPGRHGHADDAVRRVTFHGAADRHDPGVLRRSGERRTSSSRRRSGHRQAGRL